MHKSVLLENVGIIKKQRNMFLVVSSALLLSNTLLAIKTLSASREVILVPGIRSEMLISSSGVSKSYLEEMSMMFLSNLLDLSPSDIEHKKDLILSFTSNSNKKSINHLVEYFDSCIKDYKRFNLTTYFSVKNLEIDLNNLTVIAHGILTSYYGKSGHELENEDYRLEFEYHGGVLRLKSFERMVDDEKRARDKTKSLKFEEAKDTTDIKANSSKAGTFISEPLNQEEYIEDDEGEPR